MRRHAVLVWAAAVLILGFTSAFAGESKEQEKAEPVPTKSSDLYPNDFGPAEIDVSGYPKELKASYRVFTLKCAACHTIARPINSQFLELTPEELAKAKKEDPGLFKDDKLVRPEEKIWSRYVHRMMAKPGCPVKGDDGKKIWEFLVYDSKARKTGANAKAWRENRAHLLHEFQERYPDGYRKLFGHDEKSEKGEKGK